MKLLLNMRLWTIVLTLILSAATSTMEAQSLPVTWQSGMALTTYYGGGMRNQTDRLRIAADSSFERHNGMDNNKKYVLHFSMQELNDLLQYLQQKHFDKINTGQPAVMNDGWASDITLSWNGGFIGINTGAAYTVPERYKKDLADIVAYINGMADRKKKKRNA